MYELLGKHLKVCQEWGNMFPASVAGKYPVAKMLTAQHKVLCVLQFVKTSFITRLQGLLFMMGVGSLKEQAVSEQGRA
jgi:hypothetical protein